MRVSNPFYSVGPIEDPVLFYNRHTSINTLLGGLFAEKPMCRSIVGQRKIGKSSLVRHLCRKQTVEQLGYSTTNCIFLYISCQTDRSILSSKGAFFDAMIETLAIEIPESLAEIVSKTTNRCASFQPWKRWATLLRELHKHKVFVGVFFDEFDLAIVQQPLIEEGFFGSLRGYANDSPNFAWITCTNQHLHKLFQQSFDEFQISELLRKSESDFFNIAPAHVLGLFEPEEIHSMIADPAQARGIEFSEVIMDSIVRFGGRFPYFVQRAAFHFFNSIIDGEKVVPERIIQECVRESRYLWQDYWNKLDSRQQQILLAIAREDPITANSAEKEKLLATSLVYQDAYGDFHLFSREFANFVLDSSPSHLSPVALGQWLDDRYEICSLPYATPHSQIAKVYDHRRQRNVAIKFMQTSTINTVILKDLENKLRREAELLFELSHHNIGRVFDITLNPPGIVMEWVEGLSLEELHNEGISLSRTQAIKIGLDIASALEYLHFNGHIHRDIKPSNIIQTSDGYYKLIDFGISRVSNMPTITVSEDGSTVYLGTPEYSAPEQLSRRQHGPAVDIFSLGVVLYRLMTHEFPYRLGNNPELYEDGILPQPKQLTIPDDIYQLLWRLMAFDPANRPDAATLKLEFSNLSVVRKLIG